MAGLSTGPSVFLLYLGHRCHFTRVDLFLVRWGSVLFIVIGVLLLRPLVFWFLQTIVYPTMTGGQ